MVSDIYHATEIDYQAVPAHTFGLHGPGLPPCMHLTYFIHKKKISY